MRIYIYMRSYKPNFKYINSEGTRKAVHGLALGLVSCKAEVTVLCEGDTDEISEMPEGYRIQQFRNTQKHKKFKVADGFNPFIKNWLNHKDLVILSGIFQPNIYSLYCLLRRYGIPYIVLPHDPYNPAIFSKNAHLKWPYWYLIERWVLKHATAIQVLDARHGSFLRDLKIETPAIAVPNGFSQKDIYPEDLFNWNSDDIPNLLFLGRIDAHNKGLDLLLDAFAQVLETVDARLTLQGSDKGDKTSLKNRAMHLSLADKISFLEPNYDISTPLMIKDYDIFCLPSRFEGFGLSALEAMLAARVLLVSEVAGIAPHVYASGCGVVVKPEVSAIQSGLLELLTRRSEWKEMGLRGRHYVLQKLSWESIA
ncbi:MAG: glycosyltransferase, partial [Leptolyngbyaceae cyanobacterium RM2_2_4]|nr:glycosyltransferase [Leptolyngbyaceae cyanobacterium RM2_2_4]